jgi:hypothetical protein
MSRRKHAFRWFWAWEDAAEERWLEEMELKGWHLVSGPLPTYCFEEGAPARVRYALDYRTDRANSLELGEYLKLCSDAGWERVMEYSGWQYFRTTSADAPDLYTDSASRIAKYERLLKFLALIAMLTMCANLPWMMGPATIEPSRALFEALRCVVGLLCLLWVYVLVRLSLFVRKLKRDAGDAGTWPALGDARQGKAPKS